MIARIVLAATLALSAATGPAGAQIPLTYPMEPPEQTVREALAHPYGRALVAEFAKMVGQSADPACLKERTLNAAKLNQEGLELFQRYGTSIAERLINNVDMKAFEVMYQARGGPNIGDELQRLRGETVVQDYLRIERPARLAKLLDFIFENFDRYVLLTRIKMKQVAPVSTGNDELMKANPTEEVEDALERLRTGNQSPQLVRFLEISEIVADAIMTAFRRDTALTWGPRTFFGGVEHDLARLCIAAR